MLIIVKMRVCYYYYGALWLVHATDDRVVAGSNQGSAMIALFVECNLGFLLMNAP